MDTQAKTANTLQCAREEVCYFEYKMDFFQQLNQWIGKLALSQKKLISSFSKPKFILSQDTPLLKNENFQSTLFKLSRKIFQNQIAIL